MDAVSEVLVGRGVDTTGLDRMFGASAVAHLVLLAIVALVPAGWLGAKMATEERVFMTIDLAGGEGPRTGGMTAIGGRPVQAIKAVEAKKAIEPVRPPAAAEPEMIQPVKTAPKKQEAPVKTRTPDAKSRTPIRGEEIQKGSAIAQTGARGQGFGLTTGGGGTGSQINVGDFCCPEYIVTMRDLINRNWSSKQSAEATTVLQFTIQRDGTLSGIKLERSSGQPTLDFVAQRALALTQKLPPLPPAYPNPSLDVQMTFEFVR